jgi:ABC-type transport system involved in multi-copper enzyme maturation permease subunit
MNLPAALLVIRWLVWDTFRQALASRIFWVMLFVSVICIAFCATTSTAGLPLKPVAEKPERIPVEDAKKVSDFELSKSGVDVIQGEVQFLFGAVRVPWGTYRDDAVRWLQLLLAGAVADTAGLLLALIWTAAFLPTFLEPASVTVLLAKPVPRWSLLAGKYVGVVLFVALQAAVFVIGTWLALGLRTGVWAPQYLWSVLLLVVHFAVFFAFSSLLAVWTRSTIACVFGSLLFWLVCWGMNFGRHSALASLGDHADVAAGFSRALEWGYWLLPKPADFSFALSKLLEAEQYFPTATELQAVERMNALSLDLSLLSSAAFAVVMLAIAGYEFVKADY